MLCWSGSRSSKRAGVSSSLTVQADRAELHGVVRRSKRNRDGFFATPASNVRRHFERLLYSRDRRALASASWNDSVAASKVSFLPVRIGDVAQVAEPGAQVADLDVGIGLLAALDAVEKVLDVARLAVRAGLALGAVAFLDPPAFVVDDQRPLVAVEGDAEELPSVPWFDQIRCSQARQAPGNSQVTIWVSGISWSSSKTYLPPPELTAMGASTPRPQRATSTPWMPLLPSSPVPQFQNQCQL